VAEDAQVSLGEQATPLIRAGLGARLKLDYLLADSGFHVEANAAVGFAGLMRLRGRSAGGQVGDNAVVVLSRNRLKPGSLLADLRHPSWWPVSD
jgi:hypothetical protein